MLREICFVCIGLLLVGCVNVQERASGEVPEMKLEVDAKMISGNFSGYLAKPIEKGRYPGIIMIHEWWGLNDYIKETATKLASEGYVVIAIDLYDGNVATDADTARKYSGKVRNNSDDAVKKMRFAAQFLREVEKVEAVGSLGWCFGGGQSLQLSLIEPMDATVIYYGTLVDDKNRLKYLSGPVLGVFGENDTSISIASVHNFTASLNELGIKNEVYVYQGVGHAFANPSGANFGKKEADDAWNKTLLFLDKNLKKGRK